MKAMWEKAAPVRTDIALEAAEYYTGGRRSSDGIHIEEFYDKDNDILVTKVQVTNEAGQQRLHKPKGTYIRWKAPFGERDEDYHREITGVLMATAENTASRH